MLVIYGSLGMGSFKVRGPNRFDQRRVAGETDHRQLGQLNEELGSGAGYARRARAGGHCRAEPLDTQSDRS